MIKGVFLDRLTLGDDLDWTWFKEAHSVIAWDYYDTTSSDQVRERIQGAHIVVTNKVKLNENHFANSGSDAYIKNNELKLICVAATGMDHIDIPAATARGIAVCNVEAYATDSVVAHTIGLMIQLAHQLPAYQKLVEAGAWQKSPIFCLNHLSTFELAGKTLGIIGYGRLGQGVARVAEALNMKVQVAQSLTGTSDAPSALPRIPLRELFKTSDVVSLHCPLTEKTKNLINTETLSWMKPTSLLINTARGGLVNELALIDVLQSKRILGAGLDTLNIEPIATNSALFPLPSNLLITPHSAWSTKEARQRLLLGIIANVKSFLKESKKDINNA